MGERLSLAVVIPVLEGAKLLAALLPQLQQTQFDLDVMVSDGGSRDESLDIAARYRARITSAEGGRGQQLGAGITASLGDWILLLHADSCLPENWQHSVQKFASDPENESKAAYFDFRLDDQSPAAKRLEKMVAWRCRVFGLPYGDQGLLISRRFLEEMGGVPDIPLMEDVALVRKIGKQRLVSLEEPLVTSAGRFQRGGYFLRPARNILCLTLYFLGLSPGILRKLYG